MNGSIRVLQVDDERALLEQTKIFLERGEEKLDVTTALTPKKALELLEKQDFDVIVSDYQMPDMDGLEFLEVVREERESDIPFIIFTGKGREEVAIKALNLGADRYLQKGGSPKSQYGLLAQAIVQEERYYRTRRDLEVSKERYESITQDVIDHSDVAMFILDSNFEIVWINKATEDYFGIDKEKVIGKDKEELIRNKIKHIFENPDYFEKKVVSTYKDNTYIEGFESHVLQDEEKGLDERWLKHWSKPIETGFYEGGRMEHYTDITEVKKSERENEKHLHELDERFKELSYLYSLEKIIEDSDKIEDFFSQAVKLIPPSWQYPDITEARITYEDQVFKTEDFKETEWMQKSEIAVKGKEVGKVEVSYLEKRPEEDQGPFLKEEVDFINSIGSRIGSFIERKRIQEEREEYINELKILKDVMINVARMKNIDEICDYIAEKVHSLNQENYVTVALYDRDIEAIRVRSFAGFDEHQEMIGEQFVSGDEKTVFDPEVLDDWDEIYRSGNLEKMPKGLYSLVKGVFTKEESKELEGLFGVKEVYSVGFSLEEKPYGGISILKPRKGVPRFKSAIETITSHLAVILRRKQEEKKRRLSDFSLERASLEIYWITPDGRFTFANETVSERLGYSKEELKDMHVWDVEPNHGQDIRDERWKKLKEEGMLNFESELETKDGEIYPVEITSHYLEFKGREYEFAFAQDITERKEKEKALQEAKKNYEELFERSADALLVMDPDTAEILNVNQKMCEMYGYSREEALELTIEDLSSGEHPYIQEEAEKRVQKTKDEGPQTFEWRAQKSDGTLFWVEVIYKQAEISGEPRILASVRDITEKKKAEEKLRESERRFNLALKGAELGVWDWNVKTDEVKYSEQWAEILGYSPDEIEQDLDSWEKRLHPDERSWVKEELQKHLDGETDIYKTEHRMKIKSGDWIWVKDVGKVFERDEKGEPVRATGTLEDITDRKISEQKLRGSKQRLDTIISQVPAVIYAYELTDGTPQTTYVSESVRDVLGHEPEYYTKDSQNFIDDLHPEDTQKLFEKEEKLLAEEGPDSITVEYRFKDREGNYHWLRDEQKILVKEDGHQEVIGAWWDITELKKARDRIENNKNKIERLHKVSSELETCQSEEEVFNLAVDTVKDILKFELCSFAKVEDNKFIVKKRTSGLPEGDYLERSLEEGGIDTKTYKNQKSYLIKNVNKSKDAKPVSSKYKSAMSVPIGKYGVYQAVATEIDYFDEEDIKMAELLTTHVSEALKRLEIREKENFLHSLLRHDVGNKCVLVQGYLDLTKDYDLPKEVEEYIRKARNVTENGINIIDKVRKLKKIEEKDKISEVKVKSTLNQKIADYNEELRRQDINLEINGKEKTVKGGALLEDLFSNLIENSIKHSNCGKIKIDIRSEGYECIVTLEDDGKGIKDEEKNRIFEKGYKYGESGGTGLGMYIVKEIVESYGGSVEVKDSELGGARFDVHMEKVQRLSDDK